MVKNKRQILITGITGQDGSYLAELYLHLGFAVHGLVRRGSSFNTQRIDHLISGEKSNGKSLNLHYGDMTDGQSLSNLVASIKPYAIFNLAAQSHVRISFDMPNYTFGVNNNGVLNLLEAVRVHSPESYLYQASTSELFGNSPSPQGIHTAFSPESPYAVSKLSAHELIRLWREAYGLQAISGILFNHESYRRGENFVTKKIVRNASRIRNSINKGERHIPMLTLGNLEAKRDWGWAPEYVAAMSRIIEQNSYSDVVIGTGHSASVRQFAKMAFMNFDLNYEEWITYDEKYDRPVEVNDLRADNSSIFELLNWTPKIHWKEINSLMCSQESNGYEDFINWDEILSEMN